jgi:putative 4-mercaptohistidine N1-methyltranferase
MANVLGIDHKVFAVSTVAVSFGVAAYSLYRLRSLYARQDLGRSDAETRVRESAAEANIYESNKLLSEYLVFHFGTPEQLIPYPFGPKDALDFPKRCAELCLKHYKVQDGIPKRALDVGCAVGRSTFELAKEIQEVIGIDYSQSFVDTANKLKADGFIEYDLVQEGDNTTTAVAEVPKDIDRRCVSFEQGDACNLRQSLGEFGVVLAANLICRLHHPKDFLSRLLTLLPKKGSLLVITAPYSWQREFTDKSLWLGGYTDANEQKVTGFENLQKELGHNFELVEDVNMPFFIRETARKNQWTVAHATVWRRK